MLGNRPVLPPPQRYPIQGRYRITVPEKHRNNAVKDENQSRGLEMNVDYPVSYSIFQSTIIKCEGSEM